MAQTTRCRGAARAARRRLASAHKKVARQSPLGRAYGQRALELERPPSVLERAGLAARPRRIVGNQFRKSAR